MLPVKIVRTLFNPLPMGGTCFIAYSIEKSQGEDWDPARNSSKLPNHPKYVRGPPESESIRANGQAHSHLQRYLPVEACATDRQSERSGPERFRYCRISQNIEGYRSLQSALYQRRICNRSKIEKRRACRQMPRQLKGEKPEKRRQNLTPVLCPEICVLSVLVFYPSHVSSFHVQTLFLPTSCEIRVYNSKEKRRSESGVFLFPHSWQRFSSSILRFRSAFRPIPFVVDAKPPESSTDAASGRGACFFASNRRLPVCYCTPCFTRSCSSARLPLLKRSSVPTRYPVIRRMRWNFCGSKS